jgi:hypothetical protein
MSTLVAPRCIGLGAALALIVTALVQGYRSPHARAGDEPQSGQSTAPPIPAGRLPFSAAITRSLKMQHDRMINLASALVDDPQETGDVPSMLAYQQLKLKSAEADSQNARLEREVAQSALKEFQDSTYPQELAEAEGALKLAQRDFERTRGIVEVAKDRLAKIKKVSRGSPADIAIEFEFADRVVVAELTRKKAEFSLEQAEAKRKVLVGFDKAKREKELRAGVARAIAVELQKRATLELETAKLKRSEQTNRNGEPSRPHRKSPNPLSARALALLDRALLIEEKLRAALERLTGTEKPSEPLANELQGLMNQLQALLDQAENARSAADFDTLKPRIHAYAN